MIANKKPTTCKTYSAGFNRKTHLPNAYRIEKELKI